VGLGEAYAGGHGSHIPIGRRFEQRFPGVGRELPSFVQGYAHSPESALARLGFFLERRFRINAALAAAIRQLIGE